MSDLMSEYSISETIRVGTTTIISRGILKGSQDETPVIIKTLKSDYPTTRQVAALRHEYELLQEIKIPGVIAAHGLHEDDGRVVLLLEDFGSHALSEVVVEGPMPVDIFLRLAISLTDTLEQLHRHHIIHKDIKPQNILFNPGTEEIKIADFGIATRLSYENQRASDLHMLTGTLAYMSPEQTGRMNRVVDYRTDFYSLGVTFYELLTGRLPFLATDPMELIHSHIARQPLPPHEIVPTIPQPISDIVMKLLSKMAEDRYQRAAGLKADLQACRSQLEAQGDITPFPLGQNDIPETLNISQKLYGREEERHHLLLAFDRASMGSAELLVVTGPAGMGKTALINEIQKPVVRQRGSFISGQFDQHQRNVPYSAIVQAFEELLRHIMSESEEVVEGWRERLREALGPNGQVVAGVLPDIELLLGPQPPVPDPGLTEAQNRFIMTMQQFINVFASAEHPLVLFLDDMQWSDPASLTLLHRLMSNPSTNHLLVICAYRDTELEANHPLLLMLDELRKAEVVPHVLTLTPLDESDVSELLVDTLNSEMSATRELAELLIVKTGGTPFFLNQFLKTLYQDGTLWFDESAGTWKWDLMRVQATTATENMIELMANNLQKLGSSTQHLLQLAACIGNRFDTHLLSIIADQPQHTTIQDLWEAVQEGFVVPIEEDYAAIPCDDQALVAERAAYLFVHDQVRQAAYSLLPSEQPAPVHLTIGRLLRQHTSPEEQEEKSFTLVHHFNLGRELITEPTERIDLARLNLLAGQKARAAIAYSSAVFYLRVGMELLPEESWQSDYALTFALHQERAICESLSGQMDVAEPLFDTLLTHAHSKVEKADVYSERVQIYTSLGRYKDGLAVGLEGLQMFGIIFPEQEEQQQQMVAELIESIQRTLAERSIESLLDAPTMSDPDKQAILKLLAPLPPLAFNVRPSLYLPIFLEPINISLQYGNAPLSPFFYAIYASYLASGSGDYETAYRLSKVVIELNNKLGTHAYFHKICHVLGSFVDLWQVHVNDTVVLLKQAYQKSIELGDLVFANFLSQPIIYHQLGGTAKLPALYEEVLSFVAFARNVKNVTVEITLTLFQQIILSLRGLTHNTLSLSDDVFDEESFVKQFQERQLFSIENLYYVYKSQVLFLYEHLPEALETATQARQTMHYNMGIYAVSEMVFYHALILTATYPTMTEDERQQAWEHLQHNQEQLRIWSENCPPNYHHTYLLVTAEMDRLSERPEEAQEHYEQAITLAERHGFLQHGAIASELAARFYLAQGKEKLARAYLFDACQWYLNIGATLKARMLVEKYPALLGNLIGSSFFDFNSESTTDESSSSSMSTLSRRAGLLDINAIVKASRVITSEIMLDTLLEKLIMLLIETAGAQKGALVLAQENRLTVEIVVTVDGSRTTTRPSTPLDTSSDVSTSILQYVCRSRKQVVLADASHQDRFRDDPYILKNQPRSVLALPLIHQGQVIGALYLENNLATDAFSNERVELLSLISLQGAIAIKNALLYRAVHEMTEHLQQMNTRLEESNRSLEDKVTQRTAELSQANERLQVELAERQRVEAERVQLQDEIIQMQAATLAELSTPLIPLVDQIVVMPLIGKIDSQRAEAALNALLEGVAKQQAYVVIIDITGVPAVDTGVASTLINAAQAVRLLGTQTVITGIRPEVAVTLVHLGVDLSAITTLGTLQAGIAYAMKLLPRELRPRW